MTCVSCEPKSRTAIVCGMCVVGKRSEQPKAASNRKSDSGDGHIGSHPTDIYADAQRKPPHETLLLCGRGTFSSLAFKTAEGTPRLHRYLSKSLLRAKGKRTSLKLEAGILMAAAWAFAERRAKGSNVKRVAADAVKNRFAPLQLEAPMITPVII